MNKQLQELIYIGSNIKIFFTLHSD